MTAKYIIRSAMVIASLFALSAAHAQEVIAKIRFSYKNGTSNASASLSAVPGVGSITLSGSGDVQSSDYAMPLTLDDPASIIFVSGSNFDSATVSVAAPPGYDAIIDKVARSSCTWNTTNGSTTGFMYISIVRAGARGMGNTRPLGESSAIEWGAPLSDGEHFIGPRLEFNLGCEPNGEPAAPLVVPLQARTTTTEDFVLPNISDVVSFSTSNGAFDMWTSKMHVVLSLDAGSVGDFTLTFTAKDESAPFVSYAFGFGYDSATHKYGDTITVTKTLAGDATAYVTKLTSGGGSYQSDDQSYQTTNAWQIVDWHRADQPAVRTISVTRNIDFNDLGPDPRNSLWSHDIQVFENGILISRTKHIYRCHSVAVGWDDQGNPTDWASTFQMKNVIAGYDPANPSAGYVTTTLFADDEHTDVSAKLEPSGFMRSDGRSFGARTIAESWLDDQPNDLSAHPLVTSITYCMDGDLAGLELPVLTEKTVNGVELSKSSVVYTRETAAGYGDSELIVATTDDYSASGNSIRTITKKFHPAVADTALSDRLYSIKYPNGTQKSYAYEHGTFTYGSTPEGDTFVPGDGPDFRVIVLNGVQSGGTSISSVSLDGGTASVDPIGLVASTTGGVLTSRSTAEIEIYRYGRPVRSEVRVFTGGGSTSPTFDTLSWEEFKYTSDGRLTDDISSSGAKTHNEWAGNRMVSQSDATGVLTSYTSFDAMDRVLTSTRGAVGSIPAITTVRTYGLTETVSVGAAGGEQLVSSTTYDLGHHVTQKVSPGGIILSYSYSNGDRDVTETYYPGTSEQCQRIVTRYNDGRIRDITGDKAVNEFHGYDFDASSRLRHTVHLGTTAGRSKVEIFDWLGRLVEEQTPGFNATGTIIAYHHYNVAGQPDQVKTVLSSGGTENRISADHLTQYDVFGAVSADGIDLNPPATGVGALDQSLSDRFTKITPSLWRDASGNWWSEMTKQVFTTNGSAATISTTTETQLNVSGGTLSNVVSKDTHGNATQETMTIDPQAHTTKSTVKSPDGSKVVTTSIAGLVVSKQSYASNDGTNLVHTTTYGYDAEGRQNSATDSRTGTSTTQYVDGTPRVLHAYDATGALVATYGYDSAGRVNSVTDSNGSNTATRYNGRDQVIEQSGTGTYPVQYDYDAYGQKTAMRTYRNGIAGAAEWTNWVYDANTGWLTAKIDAAATRDASGNVTNPAGHEVTFDYTYDFSNGFKKVTRTWARGTTTESRFSLSTGELIATVYYDGTPNVTYTYTRDGKIDTVTDATGTRDFTYDPTYGQLSAEALSTSFYAGANGGAHPGLVLTPSYEGTTDATHVFGRNAGYQLGYATGTSDDLKKELSVDIGYDNVDRVGTITAHYPALGSRTQLDVPFTYHYYSQSGLWQTLTQISNNGTYTLTRTFEASRDVLTNINATYNAAQITGYAYKVNTAGQRQWAMQTGSAFSDLGTSYFNYHYDSVGELDHATGRLGANPDAATDPMLPGREFKFSYDTIGNRLNATVDTEVVNYSGTNDLNQYGSRGTLKTHVSGTVVTGASVTAGGTAASTLGTYWDAVLPNAGTYGAVNVVASLNGQNASASTTAASRPATESFTYDADGNLTDDSAWHYTFDAENRLVTVTAKTNWGAPSRTLTFVYDYLGRRVRKIATGPDSGDNYGRTYVYEGWALVAELDCGPHGNDGTNQIVRSYVWGQESGTSGGGGLILETAQTTTSLAPYNVAYDGNSNLVALLDPSGNPAATYEYDPYGQLLRREGTESANNPFRFAGYYTDHETGLVYFGRRYYDPTQGRFINKDPIEEQGGLNLYGFCANDPSDRWDNLGMSWSWERLWEGIKSLVIDSKETGRKKDDYNTDQTTESGKVPDDISSTKKLTIADLQKSGGNITIASFPNKSSNNAGSLTLGDKVRILMGVASAVSPGNPVPGMIDKGVAVAQMTGSVFAGINTINPVFGVLEGGYENVTGLSLNPDTPQATLTFGQRVFSGISAELNLASTVGVGTLGAKLLAPSLTAAEETVTVYRGVGKTTNGLTSNPAYGPALEGSAFPRGTVADAAAHNSGFTENSAFTSWTTDESIAIDHATKNGSGVVLKAEVPVSRLTPSPDNFNEAEVLIRGPVTGATPKPVRGF